MRINAVNNSNRTVSAGNCKPVFKALIKDKSAFPIIKSMSEADTLEFKKIEKRLSKTKYWDLKISGIGDVFKEFKFHFMDKKRVHGLISDGIYPYDKQGNTIKIYSIIYGQENTSGNMLVSLKFKTERKADEMYDKFLQNAEMLRNRQFCISPIESLKVKEHELNMLEEAFHTEEEMQDAKCLYTKIQTKNTVGNELEKKEKS